MSLHSKDDVFGDVYAGHLLHAGSSTPTAFEGLASFLAVSTRRLQYVSDDLAMVAMMNVSEEKPLLRGQILHFGMETFPGACLDLLQIPRDLIETFYQAVLQRLNVLHGSAGGYQRWDGGKYPSRDKAGHHQPVPHPAHFPGWVLAGHRLVDPVQHPMGTQIEVFNLFAVRPFTNLRHTQIKFTATVGRQFGDEGRRPVQSTVATDAHPEPM